MFSFSKGAALKKAFAESKRLYETAVNSPGQAKNARALRMKVMVRCRAHIDQVFIEGAKKYEAYEARRNRAIVNGEETPEPPTPAAYQTVKSQAGEIISYIPDHFAMEIFSTGGLYQTVKISIDEAINQTQAIANRIWLELDLSDDFEVVRFLRDQAQEQDGDTAENNDDSDDVDDIDENEAQ
tara:strand:+ start:33 stop:581 length:549 start_codon:yes stop_codon:yes gene_type:complete